MKASPEEEGRIIAQSRFDVNEEMRVHDYVLDRIGACVVFATRFLPSNAYTQSNAVCEVFVWRVGRLDQALKFLNNHGWF
jgi:hypothetical protein